MRARAIPPTLGGLAAAAVLVLPPVAQAFRAGGARWAHVLLLASALSYALVPLAGWLAGKIGAVDQPDGRKIHAVPTPRLGGAAVFGSFTLALLANGIFSQRLGALLAAAAVVFLLGAVDDVRPLGAKTRLAVQALACGILMAGGVFVKLVPVGVSYWWAVDVPLTFLWVLGVTNAFNFLDGMDGLAGGLGVIAAGVLGALALRTDAPDLAWGAAALLGGCVGFLPFNFRPGRRALVFLGDSGSTFLGFTLAGLAIVGEWSRGNPLVSMAVPVLVFWLPLFDLGYTSIERFASGKVHTLGELLSYTGRDHIHHRFSEVLGSREVTVLFLYGFAAAVGLSALALPTADGWGASLLLLQVALVSSLLTVLEIVARRRPAPEAPR